AHCSLHSFPTRRSSDLRRRVLPWALAVCAALDALVLGVALVLGPGLLAVVGGPRYAASTMPVWPFALTGSLLALVQILLFARLRSEEHTSELQSLRHLV